MVVRLAGRLVWGTTKFAVRWVVLPIAITAATAAVAQVAADKIRPQEAAKSHEVDELVRA